LFQPLQIAIMSDAHFGHRKDKTDTFGNRFLGFYFSRVFGVEFRAKLTRLATAVSCSTGRASCRWHPPRTALVPDITSLNPFHPQIMFVQRVIDLLASRPDKMDQDAVLTALTNWNGPSLPLYIFPPHLVQNGWQVCLYNQISALFLFTVFAVLRAQGDAPLMPPLPVL
jgi:hypothetical protein